MSLFESRRMLSDYTLEARRVTAWEKFDRITDV